MSLVTFIAQRMEMGETEWYFKPDMNTCEPPVDDTEQINSPHNLDELHKAVCGCQRCSLGALRTNFVFGDGNPEADVMFIGEAPGKDEDEQGLPFVGRAGKLLTKMIEAIKLSRSEVFIGNILKCRPPQNRDPQADEIDKCEPILIRQIEIIRPVIICALGRIAGQTLLQTKSTLGALRGNVHDYHGVKLIVTYHPAALLRNPNWKPKAWEDLKFLRREYDGMEIS
ncbi:uracil-DNA glycosylase family protein [Candidatus Omnitrophota bacterium]